MTNPPPTATVLNDKLVSHYSALLREHGVTPAAVQYADEATQFRRFEVLSEIADIRAAKVLDLGCGTGDLLRYLRSKRDFRGEYVGYDITPDMVQAARERFSGDARARFEHRDIVAEAPTERFDYAFVSGIFNNQIGQTQEWVQDILRKIAACTSMGIAFNGLSRYVDYCDPGLYYMVPEDIFRFCKEQLSPRVTLRHDYEIKPGVLPYEFAVYVYPTATPTRKLIGHEAR